MPRSSRVSFSLGAIDRSGHLIHQSLSAFLAQHVLWDTDLHESAQRCACGIGSSGKFVDVGPGSPLCPWIVQIKKSFPFGHDMGEIVMQLLFSFGRERSLRDLHFNKWHTALL